MKPKIRLSQVAAENNIAIPPPPVGDEPVVKRKRPRYGFEDNDTELTQEKETPPKIEISGDQNLNSVGDENKKETPPKIEIGGGQNLNSVGDENKKETPPEIIIPKLSNPVVAADTKFETPPEKEIGGDQKCEMVGDENKKETPPKIEIGGGQNLNSVGDRNKKETPPKITSKAKEQEPAIGGGQKSFLVGTKNEKETPPKMENTKSHKPKTREQKVRQLKGEQLQFVRGVCSVIVNEKTLETDRTNLGTIALKAGMERGSADSAYKRCKDKAFVIALETVGGAKGYLRLKVPADVYYFATSGIKLVGDKNEKETPPKKVSTRARDISEDFRGATVNDSPEAGRKETPIPKTTTIPNSSEGFRARDIFIPTGADKYLTLSHMITLEMHYRDQFGITGDKFVEIMQLNLKNFAWCDDVGELDKYPENTRAKVFMGPMRKGKPWDPPDNPKAIYNQIKKELEDKAAKAIELVDEQKAKIKDELNPQPWPKGSLDDIPF